MLSTNWKIHSSASW